MKICNQGLYNFAAAVIIDLGKNLMTAKHLMEVAPCDYTRQQLEDYRKEILNTVWNLTPLTNTKLLEKIEKYGVTEIGEKEMQYHA